jgi:hypothetical protein
MKSDSRKIVSVSTTNTRNSSLCFTIWSQKPLMTRCENLKHQSSGLRSLLSHVSTAETELKNVARVKMLPAGFRFGLSPTRRI